jgi:hypothetical protein
MALAAARPLAFQVRRALAARVRGRQCVLGGGVARDGSARRRAVHEMADTSRDDESGTHGDPDSELGAFVGPLRGTVTRRHTLGNTLTFVDLTCGALVEAVAGSTETVDSSQSKANHNEIFVFAKCWGKVDKRVKVGAVVTFSGRLLTTAPRLRDTEAANLKPGSVRVSVPTEGVTLVTPPRALDVKNATPFLGEIESKEGRSVNTEYGQEYEEYEPTEKLPLIQFAKDSKTTLQPVARLCKSFLVSGSCPDESCRKRHAFASRAEAAATAASRVDALRRSKAAVAVEVDPDDPDPHGSGKLAKQHSDRVFAEWVMCTFFHPTRCLDEGASVEVARAAGTSRTERNGNSGDDAKMEVKDTSTSSDTSTYTSTSSQESNKKPPPIRTFTVGDIAGGGGTLSWELHVMHGASCVLVDPAFVSLSPRQLGTWRNLRKRAARTGKDSPAWRAWQRAETWVQICAEEGDKRRDAHIARVLVNTDAVHVKKSAGLPLGNVGKDVTEERSSEGTEGTFKSTSQVYENCDAKVSCEESIISVAMFTHVAGLFHGELDTEAGRLLTKCDVLVGMHPDQATETIVDTALALNKPFAVVPCCVFPNEFPDRKNSGNGKQVRTYVEFLEYLKRKDPEIQVAYLPFQGRSRVLYKL